jgi:hypothetical protein
MRVMERQRPRQHPTGLAVPQAALLAQRRFRPRIAARRDNTRNAV